MEGERFNVVPTTVNDIKKSLKDNRIFHEIHEASKGMNATAFIQLL